jgi:hypothetical protein
MAVRLPNEPRGPRIKRGNKKRGLFVHESKNTYPSLSVVPYLLLRGGVQVVMASGFSVVGRAGRPNNIRLSEWDASYRGAWRGRKANR